MLENKLKLVFRTYGGKNIGLGHLARCVSLAKALGEFDITFIINEEAVDYVKNFIKSAQVISKETFDSEDHYIVRNLKPDIIVIDTYHADFEYIRDLRQFGKVVIFDDNGEHNPITADVVINGNLHANDIDYQLVYSKSLLLLGTRFLVMKPEYWHYKPQFDIKKDGILVTTGGADRYNLLQKFFESLRELDLVKRFVIGPYFSSDLFFRSEEKNTEFIHHPKSLKSLIEKSKLAISPASTTVYEILFLRRNLVVYYYADNQRLLERKLRSIGISSLGYFKEIDWEHIDKVVLQEYNSDLRLKESLIDGKGVFRVKEYLMKYL